MIHVYIHDANAPTRGLRVPGMHEDDRQSGGVSIPETGVAQVKRQTGEALIEHCPSIEAHDPDDGGDGS